MATRKKVAIPSDSGQVSTRYARRWGIPERDAYLLLSQSLLIQGRFQRMSEREQFKRFEILASQSLLIQGRFQHTISKKLNRGRGGIKSQSLLIQGRFQHEKKLVCFSESIKNECRNPF